MIDVVLIDDHDIVREGLAALLSREPGVRVVGQAASGAAVAELVERCKPDLVIMDVQMPGPDSRVLVRELSSRDPGTAVIVLTMHDGCRVRRDHLEAGAAAVLSKSTPTSEVIAVIEHAVGIVHPEVRLTRRERQVLGLMAEGLSNGEIADELHITVGTVKRHSTQLFDKLGVSSRMRAVVRARGSGLLS